MDLSTFLREARSTPFAYGERDCLLWPADWIVENSWPDPAAPYRGRYDSLNGAMRFVAKAGGVLALAEVGMARSGLERISPAEAVSGDVGVGFFDGFETDFPEPCGLIRAGDRWAALAAPPAGVRSGLGGPVIGEAAMLAAWRV